MMRGKAVVWPSIYIIASCLMPRKFLVLASGRRYLFLCPNQGTTCSILINLAAIRLPWQRTPLFFYCTGSGLPLLALSSSSSLLRFLGAEHLLLFRQILVHFLDVLHASRRNVGDYSRHGVFPHRPAGHLRMEGWTEIDGTVRV